MSATMVEADLIGASSHSSAKRRTIAESFDPRKNALNVLRIALACSVLFSHAISNGGFGNEHIIGSSTLGDLGVDGFFALSGFLIARSALRSSSTRRFFWHRFLRIYPGLWLCLIVIAVVIAPLAWYYNDVSVPFSQFFNTSTGPYHYITGNIFATDTFGVHMTWLTSQPTQISLTPNYVPNPGDWSGQLWTIQFEMMCYILVGVFAFLRLLKHRWFIAGFCLILWIAAWINHLHPSAFPNYDLVYWDQNVRLAIDFFTGSLLFLFADKIPDSRLLFGFFVGVFVVGLFAVDNTANLDVLSGPCMAYIVIWLGIHLPFKGFGQKNDLSYGMYIYSFPVLQLCATWDWYRWGYAPYVAISLVITVALAGASWKIVEQNAMKLKNWQPSLFNAKSRRGLHSAPQPEFAD